MQYSMPYVFGRTLRGESFGTFVSSTAGVGVFPALQFWNGGAKNALITSLSFASTTATLMTAIAFMQSTSLGGATQTPANKLAGSTNTSTLTIYSNTLAALPLTARILGAPVNASLSPVEVLDEADCLVLPPNQGLTIVGSIIALNLTVNAKWVEIPV